jgi:hypothetical protein
VLNPRSEEEGRLNQTANNNPLKRKGDVDQQPYSRLEPVGLLGAARSHSSLESARASRARCAHPPPVSSSIARAPSSPRICEQQFR